jgi:rhodanese-related sulfurtransferase
VFWKWRSLAFRLIKSLISHKFPSVKWLTTRQLAQWLADPLKPQPILLDARSEAEYLLSHLKQAERIDPYHPNVEALSGSKDAPIVVYCSVGYRSASVAEQLGKGGFSHVYNLEGSIFQWANEDRPIFKNTNPAKLVHPYNTRWGRLLKPEHRGVRL